MEAKKVISKRTAEGSAAYDENSVKNIQTQDSVPKEEKPKHTVNMDAEETFIYIGPTTRTGLMENTIMKGTREGVEDYLKETIEKIPQVKMLIVPTRDLASGKSKARTTGTLLNKYYNDILSLRRKES